MTSVLREGNFFGGGKQFQREVGNTITALARAISGPLQQQIDQQASQIAELQMEIARLKTPPDAPDAEAPDAEAL